uniref:Uncharacterized protein n=1 Tax=Rhizophora mucronata TaxID=61149 RepID=A0A2P2INQ9_RHIMU
MHSHTSGHVWFNKKLTAEFLFPLCDCQCVELDWCSHKNPNFTLKQANTIIKRNYMPE